MKITKIILIPLIIFILWLVVPSSVYAGGPCLTNLYRYSTTNGTDYLTYPPGATATCLTQTNLDNQGTHPNPITHAGWPSVPLVTPYPAGTEGSRHGCNANLSDGGICWIRSDTNNPEDVNKDACSTNTYFYVCDGKQTSCLNYSCNVGDPGCMRGNVDDSSTNPQTPLVNPDSNGANRTNTGHVGGCEAAPLGNNNDHYAQTVLAEQVSRVGCGKTIEMVTIGIEWYNDCISSSRPDYNHEFPDQCRGVHVADPGMSGQNNGGAFPDALVWYTGDCSTCESIVPPHDPALPANQVYAGQTYTASLTMGNGGGNAWTDTAQYRVGVQDDPTPLDNTWGINRMDAVAYPVNVGESGIFSAANVVAPNTPGEYTFNWQMIEDGAPSGTNKWFGTKCTSNVTVVSSPGAPTVNWLKIGQGRQNTTVNGVHGFSGRQDSAWRNPMTVEVNATAGTNADSTEYYVAFYKGTTLLSNTTFLSDVKERIGTDPANGILLSYSSSDQTSKVWLPCNQEWFDITSNINNVYDVRNCDNLLYYSINSFTNQSKWEILWDDNMGSGKFNTAGYATSNGIDIFSDLKGNLSPSPASN